MKFRSLTKRYIVFLLSFLMAFEPFAINMLRAEEAAPTASLETVDLDIDGIVDLDEIEMPGDYLEHTLGLRGRSRGDDPETADEIDEAVTWGEWMNTISCAYAQMDDGCTDVFSFYNALGEVTTAGLNAPQYLEMLAYAGKKAAMVAAFIPGVNKVSGAVTKTVKNFEGWLKTKKNLYAGYKRMGKTFSKGIENTNTFLSHMCPPVGFNKGCAKGEGFAAYWRWVAKKTGLSKNQDYLNNLKEFNKHLSEENKLNNGYISAKQASNITLKEGTKYHTTKSGAIQIEKGTAGEMSNIKGVAHSVGIGLTVIGIAMDAYDLSTSEDMQGGRTGSYSLVKSWMSLALGVGSLIAMFCIPIVGQVLGVISIIWMCATAIGDQIGEYNKRWKAAYANSFTFLYNEDPAFRSYYDNREDLHEEEKSAALLVTEKNYGPDYKQAANAFLKANANQTSYYSAEQDAISARVYIELEKQGIVTSYYNRAEFKLPEMSLLHLAELWEKKADYMSWKPTEQEAVEDANRSFLGKVGKAINPMTYVRWAGDKIQSKDYEEEIKNNNIQKVFFCPDYVLLKKYIRWVTANKKLAPDNPNATFYRTVGLRIEQSPFNYIPLVGIDTSFWNAEIICQAFNADAFAVGVKELIYIRKVIDDAVKGVEDKTDESTKIIKGIKESIESAQQRTDALRTLLNVYKDYPDSEKEGKKILDNKDVKKSFGWGGSGKWNSANGKHTPRNILKIHWLDINQALTYDPISISQKGAELTQIIDTIKHNLDTAKMMRALLDEKRECLATIDEEFTNPDYNLFIKKGTFLNVKGSTVSDWFSGIYSLYEDMEKEANLYEKSANKYQKAADDSDQGHKRLWGFLWTVTDDDSHPAEVLKSLNEVLNAFKNRLDEYDGISEELGVDGLALANRSDLDKIFIDYKPREINEVDLEKEVNPVIPD